MLRIGLWAGLGIVILATGGTGCGDSRAPANRLNGGGSSFVYPLMSKWASTYAREKGVQVNYQSVGSGGGIQQMTARTFDFGCTDAPLNDEQLRKAQATGGDVLHIPLALGGVVPAYHQPRVEQPLRFTGPVLADLFLGKVARWNDPKLAALNPGVSLPDLPVALVYRSDGSGTTYIWADYLCKVSPEWKSRVGLGTSLRWPQGVGQKGNEGVAGQITRTPGAIGYLELIYALQNNMQYGSVQNRVGAFVRASPEAVTAAAEAALTEIPEDLRYSLTDAGGSDSYPISGTVWAVLYANQPASKGQALVDFLRWATHEGQQHAKDLHYAALPGGLVERVDQMLAQVQIGQSPPQAGGPTP